MWKITRPFDVLLVDYIVSNGSNLLDWLLHQVINWVMKILLFNFYHMFTRIIWIFFGRCWCLLQEWIGYLFKLGYFDTIVDHLMFNWLFCSSYSIRSLYSRSLRIPYAKWWSFYADFVMVDP